MKKYSLPSLLMLLASCTPQVQEEIPLVYEVENTYPQLEAQQHASFEELPVVKELPNPFLSNDGSEVKSFSQWAKRRAEIAESIQYYEIGTKPAVSKEQVKARMSGDTLFVDVTVGDSTIQLSSVIEYPQMGEAPYPLLVGASMIALPKDLLDSRPIARMRFNERQVNAYSQMQWGPFGGDTDRTHYGFVHLYPELIDNGAYSEWAWGFSRLIDGLEQLGEEVTRIDMKHIGVTGCSYAGKMALFCGAFDERVALTIAQEPGGGGAAAWRVSRTYDIDEENERVECLDRTDYHWFKESLRDTFQGANVERLPHDRHELVAMVCPRALLMLGNPDYKWLCDSSAYVSMNAAKKVWDRFGIGDRMGYSIVAGHGHCQLHPDQYPEVEAFLDKFLLGNDSISTVDVAIAPGMKNVIDLTPWIQY